MKMRKILQLQMCLHTSVIGFASMEDASFMTCVCVCGNLQHIPTHHDKCSSNLKYLATLKLNITSLHLIHPRNGVVCWF